MIQDILKYENELFEDGEGKAVEKMAGDRAYLSEEELERAKAGSAIESQDEPASGTPKASRQPTKGKIEKKVIKQVT